MSNIPSETYRIEVHQEHSTSQSPGIKLTVAGVPNVLHFSVEGAERLAIELTLAAFCLKHGVKYKKDVGWTG